MGIIRKDCDYRKQSTPSGVETPPLFNGEKAASRALIRLAKSKIWSLSKKTPFFTQTPLG